jgi:hypothetical protein
MERTVYDSQAWRELPRERCIVEVLLGDAAGDCGGLIHRHHVDPDDPNSRTVEVCAVHHPKIHAALRALTENSQREWRRCPHGPGAHRYAGAREACERRLNGFAIAA